MHRVWDTEGIPDAFSGVRHNSASARRKGTGGECRPEAQKKAKVGNWTQQGTRSVSNVPKTRNPEEKRR